MSTKVSKLSVSAVNKLNPEQFVKFFKNVIELFPAAANSVKDSRPFRNIDEICDAFHEYVDYLNSEETLRVLNLLPDLAGRLATEGKLSEESTQEQKSAGLHELTASDKKLIDESNRRYKKKFGFPFIICARENKVQSIMHGLRTRYGNSRDKEMKIGIGEVKKICKLRILDIVKTEI